MATRQQKIEALKQLQSGKIRLADFVAGIQTINLAFLADDELILLERVGGNAEARKADNTESVTLSETEAECFEYYRLLSHRRQSLDACNGYKERVADWYRKLNIDHAD